MSKRRGNLFEEHIDKIILGVAVILGLSLLWMFVLRGPYSVEYGGKKLGPGEIDDYIKRQQVQQLTSSLDESPEPREYRLNKNREFTAKLLCSVPDIRDDLSFPIPGSVDDNFEPDRRYVIPSISGVSDVAVEAIRTVAYVPAEEVDMEHPYDMVEIKLADIDFVTVQGSFDVAGFRESFYQSFAGRRVKKDWQDVILARPVFAGVQLQRQQLLDGVRWSDWQSVPRTKIDHLKKILSIPQKVSDVKFGVTLLMGEISGETMQTAVLQPRAYDFAASNEKWFPPVLHREYKKLLKQAEELKSRQERESQRSARQRDREGGRTRTTRKGLTGQGATGGARSTRYARTTGRAKRGTRDRQARGRSRADRGGRKSKKERTLEDVFKDMAEVSIDEKNTLDRMRGPLVFWAHDDTITPGESYRYRIQLGVFNPIAGRDWFRDDQKHLKEEVILWSGYSDVTDTVMIPQMIHFFPLDIASRQENSVLIQVSKYHIGKWQSEEFEVRSGQMIGEVVTQEPEQQQGVDPWDRRNYSETEAETIDYSTGAILVDLVETSKWTGRNLLKRREYLDVLYTTDGVTIAHLGVKKRNWPKELEKQFKKIKEAASEEVQIVGRQAGGNWQEGGGGGTNMPFDTGPMMRPEY